MIDKIALLYCQNGKVLSTLSKGKSTYYLPGGKREGNESDLETLSREIREELQVSILPDTAQYYGTFEAQAHGKDEGVIVRMTCYTSEFSGEPQPDSEIAEIIWLDSSDMEKISPVDKLIFNDLLENGLIK